MPLMTTLSSNLKFRGVLKVFNYVSMYMHVLYVINVICVYYAIVWVAIVIINYYWNKLHE